VAKSGPSDFTWLRTAGITDRDPQFKMASEVIASSPRAAEVEVMASVSGLTVLG
jgi:hypothetical protein